MIFKQSTTPPLLLVSVFGISILFFATIAMALFDANKSQEINALRTQLIGQLALNQELRDELAAARVDNVSSRPTPGAGDQHTLGPHSPRTLHQRINRLAVQQDALWAHLEMLRSALASALQNPDPYLVRPPSAPLTPYDNRYATDRPTASTPDAGVAPPLPDPDLQPPLTLIHWRR